MPAAHALVDGRDSPALRELAGLSCRCDETEIRVPRAPDMSGVRYLRTVEEPQHVACVKLCRRVFRALCPVEPVAQLVSVHCPGHTHVLTVLAPVGPPDRQVDQFHEFRSQIWTVVSGGQVTDQSLFRAPGLGVFRPVLWVACLPLQEEQRKGQPRPRADFPVGVVAPTPQRSREAATAGIAVCPHPGSEPQLGEAALVQPLMRSLDLPAGSGVMVKGSSALSGVRRYQAESPRQVLDPRMAVVGAQACRFCHSGDHFVRGYATTTPYAQHRSRGCRFSSEVQHPRQRPP